MQKIEKKTKIFATIGPSSDNHDMMKALFEAGMNVIRLPLLNKLRKKKTNSSVLISTLRDLKFVLDVSLENMSLSRRATKSFSRWDVKMLTEMISSVESKMMEPS